MVFLPSHGALDLCVGNCYTFNSFAMPRMGLSAECRSAGRLVIERGEGITWSRERNHTLIASFCVPVLCFLFGHTSRLGGNQYGDAFSW